MAEDQDRLTDEGFRRGVVASLRAIEVLLVVLIAVGVLCYVELRQLTDAL